MGSQELQNVLALVAPALIISSSTMFYINRHHAPYDVPNGPGAGHGAFENGQDDQRHRQPEHDQDQSLDGPLEQPEPIDQPEEGQPEDHRGSQATRQPQQEPISPPLPKTDSLAPGIQPTQNTNDDTNLRAESDTRIRDAVPRTPEQEPPVSPVVTYPHVEGQYGIPLDAIRDEMGDAMRAVDVTLGGSGASIRYQLDRDAGLRPGEDGHAYIEVEDLKSGVNMSAQTEQGGDVARFGIFTVDEKQPAPDMDPERFVAWALDTFGRWGNPPQRIVELLVPGSAGLRQLEEAIQGTETTMEEAVRLTEFGRIYGQNGFTEIDTITTNPSSSGDHVRIEFTRPDASRNTSQNPHSEVGRADPLTPHPSDGAQTPQESVQSPEERAEAYWAEVEVYLEEERPVAEKGAFTEIPTVTGPMGFTNVEGLYTGSDLLQYALKLFSDELAQVPSANRIQLRIRTDAQPLAGGIAGVLAPGNVVLDIGSGEAIALHELARYQQFKKVIFWGVDIGYAEERELNPDIPGVQLSRADWTDLRIVPTGRVNAILTNLGVLTHTREPEASARAIDRIAAPGAILRGAIGPITRVRGVRAIAELERLGWAITPSTDDSLVVCVKRGHDPIPPP